MVRSTAMSMVVGLAFFGLAACGGDDATGPDDSDVSEEQAAEVAAAVSAGMGHAFSLALAGGGSASMAPVALNPGGVDGMPVAAEEWNIETSGACPQGGTASVDWTGNVTSSENNNSTTVNFDWNADVGYDDCGVDTDDGVFTLSTSSPLAFTGNGTVTSDDQGSGSGSFTWNMNGSMNWSEGGASGSCSINMTTSLDFTSSEGGAGSWTGSITGSVCGHSVDETWDTTFSA